MTPVSPAPADRPARLLFVHAHPDDETLTCGTAMAHYARAGHEVVVLTCTLGEEGEVIPPELAHLASDRCDTLGPWRREELREAMTRLGVRHAVLGEDRACGVLSRYRDSGMAGSPAAARPGAWVNADPDEAADLIGAHIRGVRPDVVVTYDEHGGYRHPDHVQTHRMTVRAVASLREHERPARLALVLTPQSWAREDRAWLRAHVPPGAGLTLLGDDAPYPALVVPDEVVTHAVADPAAVPAQARALAAHRTQVTVFDGYYALSNDIAARLAGREGFALADPATGALLVSSPERLPSPGEPGPARPGLLGESAS